MSHLSTSNRLLSAIPDEELSVLRPHLRSIWFKPGEVVAEQGDIVDQCYFPTKGMISLLAVTEQGLTVEVAYTGREGMLGLSAALGPRETLYQWMAQAETECMVADAGVIFDLFNRKSGFHDRLLQYLYALLKQLSQTCVCNHFHTIEERLSRWLTVMSERSERNRLALTHEFLAHMLGVQRTSIGLVANAMQSAGIIRYSRGIVEIKDEGRLKDSACECYTIVNDAYKDLFRNGKT